jgi:hypothetical protein
VAVGFNALIAASELVICAVVLLELLAVLELLADELLLVLSEDELLVVDELSDSLLLFFEPLSFLTVSVFDVDVLLEAALWLLPALHAPNVSKSAALSNGNAIFFLSMGVTSLLDILYYKSELKPLGWSVYCASIHWLPPRLYQ